MVELCATVHQCQASKLPTSHSLVLILIYNTQDIYCHRLARRYVCDTCHCVPCFRMESTLMEQPVWHVQQDFTAHHHSRLLHHVHRAPTRRQRGRPAACHVQVVSHALTELPHLLTATLATTALWGRKFARWVNVRIGHISGCVGLYTLVTAHARWVCTHQSHARWVCTHQLHLMPGGFVHISYISCQVGLNT